jgi:hypothetical protein
VAAVRSGAPQAVTSTGNLREADGIGAASVNQARGSNDRDGVKGDCNGEGTGPREGRADDDEAQGA